MVFFCRFVSVLAFLCASGISFGQGNEIKVRFIGNCGLYMTDGVSNVYIDFPYKSGAHNYMEYDLSELDSVRQNPTFIYTHKHADHYSKKLVKRLSKKLGGNIYGPWNVKKFSELSNSIPGFSIQPYKTRHRFSFNHYSYLITWHDKKIFISGDTEHAETIGTLKDIDWAFVPTWLVSDAKVMGIKLKEITKMMAIYHIAPRDNISSDDPFFKLLDTQGEIISIPY